MCSTAGSPRRSCGACYDASMVTSKRGRPVTHAHALREAGQRLKVMELQGPLHFGSAESFSRAFAAESAAASHVVLDFSRVTSVDPGAVPVISATVRGVEGRVTVVMAGRVVGSLTLPDVATYRSIDIALERCEDEILELLGTAGEVDAATLADQELLRGLSSEELESCRRRDGGGARCGGDEGVPRRRRRRLDLLRRVRSREHQLGGGRARDRATHHDRSGWLLRRDGGGGWRIALHERGRRDRRNLSRAAAMSALKGLEAERPDLVSALFRNLAEMLSRRLRAANGALRALQA